MPRDKKQNVIRMPSKPGRAPSRICAELRALRKRTGYSMAACARLIGQKGTSSWQHYERRYFEDVLPLWLLQAIKPHFVAKGIRPEEIDALGGLTPEGPKVETAGLPPLLVEIRQIAAEFDELEKRFVNLRKRLRGD